MMAEHVFRMRLFCRYEAPDNTVAELLVEYIVGRMKQCPVSGNIKETADSKTEVMIF